MGKFLIVILFVAFSLTTPVIAGIYKWTDKDGNVHFGDQPVNQKSAKELNIKINNKTGFSNSSGNKGEREYLLKKIDEKKIENAEKRKKRLAKKKEYKQKCRNYKSHYQAQIQANSMYTMSPSGERTYLSDKGRASRMKKIKKGIAKYCR